ncbi:MAG TPA: hypothetical protein PKI34_01165 [Bacteroidales bacterium]|nr:hypothetical protein [Bacteroidales bacterium]
MITIDIETIDDAADIERFFTLLHQAGILFYPNKSFYDYYEWGNDGEMLPLFCDYEAMRLDRLMNCCLYMHDEKIVDIWRIAEKTQSRIFGDLKRRN